MNKEWPFPDSEVKNILMSVKRIFQHKDMKYMTKGAYVFIMNLSGFIAHYDINGFREEYGEDMDRFAKDLMRTQSDAGRYMGEWFVQQYGEEYCKGTVATHTGICQIAKMYLQGD